ARSWGARRSAPPTSVVVSSTDQPPGSGVRGLASFVLGQGGAPLPEVPEDRRVDRDRVHTLQLGVVAGHRRELEDGHTEALLHQDRLDLAEDLDLTVRVGLDLQLVVQLVHPVVGEATEVVTAAGA